MPVSLVMEYDIPKGKPAVQEYLKVLKEKIIPICDNRIDKTTGLSDNTGHMIAIWEFKDMTSFSALWEDETYHRAMMSFNPVVDNLKIRLCRPSIR